MAKYRYRVTKDNMKEVFDHVVEFLQKPTKYRKAHKGDDGYNGNEISLIAPNITYTFLDARPKIIIQDLLLGKHLIEITCDGDNIVEIDATRRMCIYNICDHMVGYKTKIIDEHRAYMSHSFQRVSKITNEEISLGISRLICSVLSEYYEEVIHRCQLEETLADSPMEVLNFERDALAYLAFSVSRNRWAFRDDVNRPVHISLVKYHIPGDAYMVFDYHQYIDSLSEDAPFSGYDISKSLTYHYVDNVNNITSDNPKKFLHELEKAFDLGTSLKSEL